MLGFINTKLVTKYLSLNVFSLCTTNVLQYYQTNTSNMTFDFAALNFTKAGCVTFSSVCLIARKMSHVQSN